MTGRALPFLQAASQALVRHPADPSSAVRKGISTIMFGRYLEEQWGLTQSDARFKVRCRQVSLLPFHVCNPLTL